jgi:hypothetical protein
VNGGYALMLSVIMFVITLPAWFIYLVLLVVARMIFTMSWDLSTKSF